MAELLAHLQPGQRYGLPPVWLPTARALERRGLLRLTECGMATSAGRPVLIVSLP